MNRIDATFAKLATQGRKALIPYVTAGDPTLEVTSAIIDALVAAGADVIELGVPFSDPIADGAEIQRASEWAVRRGVGIADVLALAGAFRRVAATPLVVMTYANPVVHYGIERFAADAAAAGVDGVLVSDLPTDECPELWAALDAAGLDTITLVAPTTARERLPAILARSRGFVYCLARTGVTGRSGGVAGSLPERIAGLRALTDLPVAVGFGISSTDDARALRGSADAIVVGAAFMRAIAEDPERGAVDRAGSLARAMITALKENGAAG
jgi:tryptophan synthase alpha chain